MIFTPAQNTSDYKKTIDLKDLPFRDIWTIISNIQSGPGEMPLWVICHVEIPLKEERCNCSLISDFLKGKNEGFCFNPFIHSADIY